MSRLGQLDREYDVVIAGGGIVGAGIARDAALRGVRVCLVEARDFGGGTTSGSTRLIHGGLRYLEMLDFRLVRMDLREREILLKVAPHLVKPLEFLIPFHRRSWFYRAKLRAGLALYDALSYDKSLPNHRFLNAAETARAEPGLERAGLQGAASYFDAQVDSPERLCVENILDSRAHGADALNYAEVVGAVWQADRVAGVRVKDAIGGGEREIRARLVVNASGPWLDRLARKLEPEPEAALRTTKGVHVACEPVSRHANVLFSNQDGRLFFVIPWMGYSWIGTTDTDYDGDPREACATEEDIDYLMRSARACFPALAEKAMYWTTAGVRALVKQPGAESSVSRLHRVVERVPGLVSVLGGKITAYRAIAEEVTDLACRRLGVSARCVTAEAPLPAGVRTRELASEVLHGVREEMCLRVSDFLLRRTEYGFAKDQGLGIVEEVARVMGAELEWSAERERVEVEEYRHSRRRAINSIQGAVAG